MKKRKLYLIFLTLLCSGLLAQIKNAELVKKFYQENPRGKLQLLNSSPYEHVEEIYPLISDTLEELKNKFYKNNGEEYKDLRFQFDQLIAKKEMHRNNHVQAIYLLEHALRHSASGIDDSLSSLALLKEVYVRIKNIHRALEIHHLIETKWNRRSNLSKIDQGPRKSYLFHLLGMHSESIAELRKEFNEEADKKDTTLLVNFYNDLGVFYNQEKNADSASANLLKAKEFIDKIKDDKNIQEKVDMEFYSGLIDGNLGFSYLLKGKNELAIPLLNHDAISSKKTKHYLSAFNAYHALTDCYLGLKDRKNARSYLDTSLMILNDHLKDVLLKHKILPTQAKYYMLTNNFEAASNSYREYFRLNDSIILAEKKANLVNQGLAFDINQREFEYKELDRQLKEAQLKEAKEKIFRISVLSGMLILLTIIIFLSINNHRIKMREKQLSAKNLHIQAQNTQIEHTLKEKEALMKEIHHRVKNNLQIINSMLNLQIGRIQDEKTENIFLEAKQRINAIALTHQMLYQKATLSEVNLAEYIQSLVHQISATMARKEIQIRSDLFASNETLTIDGAVPLGLIINELVTNAFKHGFPNERKGMITVSLIDKGDSLLIKISDNGVGLPENFKLNGNLSLGMELVLILIEQLESELIIESKEGSTFMFEIKKNNHKLQSG